METEPVRHPTVRPSGSPMPAQLPWREWRDLRKAPPAALGFPALDEFDSKDLAADQGTRSLQNWVYSNLIFWPLALDAHPRNAVGLQVDWGGGLDKFVLLSSAADDESKEHMAQELLVQLEGLLADGSVSSAALLVWAYFIQAIDRQLAEGTDLPRLLQLLAGFLSGNISPLFQDAAAYCGCAIFSYWTMHQQPISTAAAPAIGVLAAESVIPASLPQQVAAAGSSSTDGLCAPFPCLEHADFLSAVAALVRALGRDGVRLLKERKECADPSAHPGCRAAALAYSSCTMAMQLQTYETFSFRLEALRKVVDAGFGLAPLFGVPPGELLTTWQLTALTRFLLVVRVPTWIAASAKSDSSAAMAREGGRQLEIVARCQLMQRYIELMTGLTEPFKVAVLEPERGGAALQAQKISEHLYVDAESMQLLVEKGLQVEVFMEHGIPPVLSYLNTYAQLQPSLPWVHPAHVVACDMACALWSLLRWQQEVAQQAQRRRHDDVQRLLVECGVIDTMLAVVRSAPSISEAIKYFEGSGQGPAHDRQAAATTGQASALSPGVSAQPQPSAQSMGAGTGQQAQQAQQAQQPGQQCDEYRFRAIRNALLLLEALAQSSPAARQALLEAGCARVLIKRMAHLQKGVPLWEVERQSLPPVAGWLVGKWTGCAIGTLTHLVAPPQEAGPEADMHIFQMSMDALRQLDKLVSPVDLLGLLKWQDRPKQPEGTEEREDASPLWDLESAVLPIAFTMAVARPGVYKELQYREETVQYLEETLVAASHSSPSSTDLMRHSGVLAILKDMAKHCSVGYIATRFLRAGSTGESIVSAAMLMLAVGFTQGISLEPPLAGGLQPPQGRTGGAATWQESIEQLALAAGNSVSLQEAAVGLLEAILWRDAPELKLEAGRIKADMKRMHLQQAATAAQASRDETLREAGRRALACIQRANKLAELGQQQAQQEQKDRAAAAVSAEAVAAAEAAAAALLAEEEAAQQASTAKAAKRQRQKAAKQAQQAAAAAQQEERARQEQEEREQRGREEQECKAQEKAQRAAQAAAAALQVEQEAAQRRAAAKAAKRQRKKAAKQAQQEAAGDNTALAADASSAVSQPSSSTVPAASTTAAATPEPAILPVHESTQQGKQRESGQAAAGAQALSAAQVCTPEQKEGRSDLAPAEDDQEASIQALLSVLIPGALELNTPIPTPSPTSPPAGVPGSCSNTPLQQAQQQQGTMPTPALAAVLRCALSRQQLQDPVVAADGWTYERQAITSWLAAGETTSPVTGQPLGSTVLRPNYALRQLLGSDII